MESLEVVIMSEFRDYLGSFIRLYRESKGLTLRELADYIDVPFTSLSKMESGDQRIDSEFLVKLADYFGVSIVTILSRSLDEADKDAHQRENKPGIREALRYILDNYQGARSEIFKNHVRNVIKKMIIEEADLDENRFFIVGSVGQGQWAENKGINPCYDWFLSITLTFDSMQYPRNNRVGALKVLFY